MDEFTLDVFIANSLGTIRVASTGVPVALLLSFNNSIESPTLTTPEFSYVTPLTLNLKGVLEPFSTQGNLDLFKRAGFVDITTISKYICFEGFLLIK